MKKVSIITPVYKVEHYIEECVRSVLSQTYQNIEFILIDDCGGDGSVDIINNLIKQNTTPIEIRLISHKKNKGVSAARNTALKAATGDYILCVDSDDRLEYNAVEKLLYKANETNADMVVCSYHSDGINANLGGMLQAHTDMVEGVNDCFKALACCWFNVAPWCKFIKHNLIKENDIFFYPDIINEDALWTFRLCAHVQNIAFLNESLYFYRYNNNSIMWNTNNSEIIRSNRLICEQMVSEIQKRKNLRENLYVYINYMNVFNTYLNRLVRYKGYREMKVEINDWSKFKYSSKYFRLSSCGIPVTYRLLNIIFYLPEFTKKPYIYMVQKILNKTL